MKLDKAHDAQLARIQGAVLHLVNPFTCSWSDFVDQGLTQNLKAAVIVSDVLDITHRSFVFLGNANNLISDTRRVTALEFIYPSMGTMICPIPGVTSLVRSLKMGLGIRWKLMKHYPRQ